MFLIKGKLKYLLLHFPPHATESSVGVTLRRIVLAQARLLRRTTRLRNNKSSDVCRRNVCLSNLIFPSIFRTGKKARKSARPTPPSPRPTGNPRQRTLPRGQCGRRSQIIHYLRTVGERRWQILKESLFSC